MGGLEPKPRYSQGEQTWMLSTGIEPNFLSASFRSELPLMVGNLNSPSAATKIVTWFW